MFSYGRGTLVSSRTALLIFKHHSLQCRRDPAEPATSEVQDPKETRAFSVMPVPVPAYDGSSKNLVDL